MGYDSVCSPNHLHKDHVRLTLRVGTDALCEKSLVLDPWNLDALAELNAMHGLCVWTVIQLCLHPMLIVLKTAVDAGLEPRDAFRLTHVTRRGAWYRYS